MKKEIKCPVLENLIKEHRTPALFIGAGFSKRYLEGYYTWHELLLALGKEIGVSEFIINNKYNTFLAEGCDDGVAKQKIGSFLEDKLNDLIQRNEFSHIINEEEQEIINKHNYSPFKFLIARLLKNLQIKKEPSYLFTELNHFKKLVSKLPCIITTNYDKLIETLFQDKFTTYVNQEDYFYNHNCLNAEIYKIHGSISNPNTLVITESDYNNFLEKSHLTIAKLLNILSLSPIVFIGYSLSDPNIQLLFERLLDCINEEQLSSLEKNLIFVEYKEHCITMNSNNYKEIKLKNKSIKATYIITDNFTRLFQYLNQFTPVASPLEIKKYHNMIRELIISNDESLPLIIGQAMDLNKIPEEVCITGFSAAEVSYAKLPMSDFILDVLFDKNEHTPYNVLEKWFSQSISKNTLAPLYYYLKKGKKENLILSDSVKEKVNEFLRIKRNLKIPECPLYQTVSLLDKAIEKEHKVAKKITMLTYNFYEDKISKKEYTTRLQEIYNKDNSVVNSSEFKKAVLLLDYDKSLKI